QMRSFRIDPADTKLLVEIRRLAGVTSRWEDVLQLEGFRFHRAEGDQKLAIALEAAALVEEKGEDPLRAFRAYLRAFQLKPDDTAIRDHLWRLARTIDVIDEQPGVITSAPRPNVLAGAAPVRLSDAEEKESTLEISLDDLLEDSRPIVISDEPRK